MVKVSRGDVDRIGWAMGTISRRKIGIHRLDGEKGELEWRLAMAVQALEAIFGGVVWEDEGIRAGENLREW